MREVGGQQKTCKELAIEWVSVAGGDQKGRKRSLIWGNQIRRDQQPYSSCKYMPRYYSCCFSKESKTLEGPLQCHDLILSSEFNSSIRREEGATNDKEKK